MFRAKSLVAAAFVFAAVASPCLAQDGLFANIQTNRGSITAKLDYEKAPSTVANFVSLVEGSRGWVDTTTGALRKEPFYNGITFHRVIPGFVIQAGSRNGLGTDGPGYASGDEFHPPLRHNVAGTLSMANSGPDSNGSQFFITLAPTPSLDNKHSVFGYVTDGMNVVNAIGAVPTPVATPDGITTIQSITISRVGAAAQAFDATGPWGLPVFGDAGPQLLNPSGNFALRFARPPFARHIISRSDDLATWTPDATLTDLLTPSTVDHDVTAALTGKSKQFFRVVRASYPQQTGTFVNRTLALNLISSNQTLDLSITGEPRAQFGPSLGSVRLNGSPGGNVIAYVTAPGIQNQQFVVAMESLYHAYTVMGIIVVTG
ncbi:MAG: peptidylprolyl isomerase [Chthoniobacterales bacterium]